MLSKETPLIRQIVAETNGYLDGLQRQALLWADVDSHIAASHIAEYVGDLTLVSRHLQTVTRLFLEIQSDYPAAKRFRKGAAVRRPCSRCLSRRRRIRLI